MTNSSTGRPSPVRWRRLACLVAVWAMVWSSAGGLAAPTRRAYAAGGDALVRCNPADPTTPYTSDVEVDIYIENVADLYGADTRLTFDTSLAQVVDADVGVTGVQIQPLSSFMAAGFTARKIADNTAGTIWYAATQVNPTPPANGSGPIASFTLHPLTYGSFTLEFTSVKLSDRNGFEITSTTQSCLVNFTTPTPTTTGLSPDNALANSGAFTLTVTGTNFIDGSVVYWGGAPRPTVYVSDTEVQASIPASDLETAGPVAVTVVNPAPGGGASNAQTFTVDTYVHFSQADYSAAEDAGPALVPVVLDAPSSITVTVDISSTDQTATAGDYTPLSQTVTFAPGVVTETVSVSLTPDLLDELDETLLLSLSAPSGVLLGSPDSATLTILDDDDPPTVQFASAAYTVTESAGTAPIDVVLSAASGLTVTVAYSTTDLSAGPDDYVGASGTLTFTPGTITQTFEIEILPDMLVEPDEDIALALSDPTSASLGTPDEAVLTILDDEGLPNLAFEQADYTAAEAGGPAVLTVTLSTASAFTVTVDFDSTAGTATAEDDYTPISGTLTFTPGVTVQTISLPVLDDQLDEDDETVPVALSAPTNAGLGAPSTTTVTIVDDDDPPTVQFESGAYTATEGALTAPITVTLSAASGLTVTVIYSTTGGTATPGDDYTPISATLSLPPGALSGTFSLSLEDDELDELTETVALSLLAPVNATLGTPDTAVLSIEDDDEVPLVRFELADYSAPELDGDTLITVTLDAPAALTVTVPYSTANGTATAGSDYLTATGTLTFTPGLTVTVLAVTIISDTVDEDDETVLLSLGTPVGAMLGTPASAVLTIVDDDVLFKIWMPIVRR